MCVIRLLSSRGLRSMLVACCPQCTWWRLPSIHSQDHFQRWYLLLGSETPSMPLPTGCARKLHWALIKACGGRNEITIYCVVLYSNSPLYLCKQTLVSFGKSPSLAHTVLERHGNEDALPSTLLQSNKNIHQGGAARHESGNQSLSSGVWISSGESV